MLHATFSAPWIRSSVMRITSRMVALIALGIVVALAAALHLYGRELGRLIHGR